ATALLHQGHEERRRLLVVGVVVDGFAECRFGFVVAACVDGETDAFEPQRAPLLWAIGVVFRLGQAREEFGVLSVLTIQGEQWLPDSYIAFVFLLERLEDFGGAPWVIERVLVEVGDLQR